MFRSLQSGVLRGPEFGAGEVEEDEEEEGDMILEFLEVVVVVVVCCLDETRDREKERDTKLVSIFRSRDKSLFYSKNSNWVN